MAESPIKRASPSPGHGKHGRKPGRTIAAEREIVGWREFVDLPDWGIERLRAKADTGARSSAVDVTHLIELPGDRVRFCVVTDRRNPEACTPIEADIVRRTRVRSSLGEVQDRLFVRTLLRLAGHELSIELGLVSRESMLCRMLLGRETLAVQFTVDPGRAYLHGYRRRRRRQG